MITPFSGVENTESKWENNLETYCNSANLLMISITLPFLLLDIIYKTD